MAVRNNVTMLFICIWIYLCIVINSSGCVTLSTHNVIYLFAILIFNCLLCKIHWTSCCPSEVYWCRKFYYIGTKTPNAVFWCFSYQPIDFRNKDEVTTEISQMKFWQHSSLLQCCLTADSQVWRSKNPWVCHQWGSACLQHCKNGSRFS